MHNLPQQHIAPCLPASRPPFPRPVYLYDRERADYNLYYCTFICRRQIHSLLELVAPMQTLPLHDDPIVDKSAKKLLALLQEKLTFESPVSQEERPFYVSLVRSGEDGSNMEHRSSFLNKDAAFRYHAFLKALHTVDRSLPPAFLNVHCDCPSMPELRIQAAEMYHDAALVYCRLVDQKILAFTTWTRMESKQVWDSFHLTWDEVAPNHGFDAVWRSTDYS